MTPSRGSVSIAPILATTPLLHQCQGSRLATPSLPRTESRSGLGLNSKILLGAQFGPVRLVPQVGVAVGGGRSASNLTIAAKELSLKKSKPGNGARNVSGAATRRDNLYSDLLEKLRRLEAEASFDD
ncbi:hypothetical protein P691DRAFT_786729 [Macrolepiota fuliginosa MF-IS2]|uniref:Uncharacterized protein n=1 Tax=Macrolepiota fuliginosa MF-IS2 TaxID=1400762 RepID=A0A9P6BYL9_9AGAR|nr:hypothetical protein P691DRAFT_786729 [Macrolepiota fuliginosa MF-IS2]